MNIAMLAARFPPVIGGAEIQCYRLSRWLVRHQHRVVVLTERSDPALAAHEWVEGIEVIRFRTIGRPPFSSMLYGIQTFLYLLRNPGFDVLHAHIISTPAIVAVAIQFFRRIPALVKVAGGRRTGDFSTSRRYALGRFKLWVLRQLKPRLVCPSQETFDEARAFGIPEDRLSCIPNGIDAEQFRPAVDVKPRALPAGALPWALEDLVAIYVGRWAKGKGVETLLEVWEEGARRPDFPWRLLMVLSESPPESIAVRLRNLGSRVHTACHVTDLLPCYQAADLAVLLSEGEGISNFLLEAMACGLPALTTSAAALPDAGEERGIRRLTLEGRAVIDKSLNDLVAMARDRGHLRRMGQASRRHIEERYTFEIIGPSYLSLYKKMVD